MQPLFEFSGACAGCGETPYIKLATQLFGDRMLIANATGCSSIYGGNLPTTPYTVNRDGRGPAWANSLFEDNAEFGFGMRLAIDKQGEHAVELVKELGGILGDELVSGLLTADQGTEQGIAQQRERVVALKARLAGVDGLPARRLLDIADYLVKKSLWIIGGDGWAYDIGYGGLDHVLAQGRNVNILVLDTEVYSNTGGQASKSTPIGAVAKFAMAGKSAGKKDLALMAIAYGNVYVARIAFGAKDAQTVKAFQEAESYDGPSLILAYSHCIAHGYDMAHGLEQQKLAVDSAYWPIFRCDPRRVAEGQPGLVLDSSAPKVDVGKFMANETRFRMLDKTNPERAKMLLELARRAGRLALGDLREPRPRGRPGRRGRRGPDHPEGQLRTRSEDNGSLNHLPRAQAPPPDHAGRFADGRQDRPRQADGGRRGGRHRHALPLRGAAHEGGARHLPPHRRPRRLVRRGDDVPAAPRRVQPRAGPVPRAARAGSSSPSSCRSSRPSTASRRVAGSDTPS